MARNRSILPSVRKLAQQLDVDVSTPESRLCEALAHTIDAMTDDERARMLPNHAGPLLKALQALREQAPAVRVDEGQGLSDDELQRFVQGVKADHGSV